MPKSAVSAGNSGRQDKLAKQHACITTFEELVNLCDMQAEMDCSQSRSVAELDKARAKADTIWYDYVVMDELGVRLGASNKTLERVAD